MKTQNRKGANAVSKSESKNASTKQVNNASNTTRRVVETRDMYEVIYNHSVSLVAEYIRCFTNGEAYPDGEKSRKGFAFGPTNDQPHTRGYAKSLIWGFATNKAGKVLKNLDDVADKANRAKIAIAILTDVKLVKGDSKAIEASLNRVEPKRERTFAESVLAELTKSTKPTSPKGGKPKGESKPKATAPKGSKDTKSTAKSATLKGSKDTKSTTKPTAPKGSKANGGKSAK